MRWSEAVTLEFIKLYLKHDCLWNPSHPGYKLRCERQKAYAIVCAEFNEATNKCLSITEVRIKYKNLRTTYMQEVHKILQKSSPDEMYEPSLVWFHEMDRCLKQVNRLGHSNSFCNSQETSELHSSLQTWDDPEILGTNTEELNPDPLTPQSDDECDSIKPLEQTPKLKRHLTARYYKKNKKKKLKRRVSSSLSSESHTDCAKEDEFDIYGKYIASQLRKMDLRKALRLQLDIQNLVSEARISA